MGLQQAYYINIFIYNTYKRDTLRAQSFGHDGKGGGLPLSPTLPPLPQLMYTC